MSYLGVLPFYISLVSSLPCIHVYENIYILDIFTEKRYSKPLECDTVYFTIFTFLIYLLKSAVVNHWNVIQFTLQYLHS